MMRRLVLALVAASFGGMAGSAALVLLYGLQPALTLDMDHDRPGLLVGFYKGERAADLTFAWTTDRGDVPLPGLDRSIPWTVTARVRGARQDASTLPAVTLLADGVPLVTKQTTNEFADVSAVVPAHEHRARGLVLSVAASNTFVPGPRDSRALGVQVDEITLTPEGRRAFPPPRAVAVTAVSAACFGAVFGLLAATATTAVAASSVLAVAEAVVIRAGLGPYTDWLGLIVPLSLGIGVTLLAAAVAVERWRGERLRHTARFALMFTGSVLLLKLLVLFHPDKWLIDALFHAHRLETVMAGNYLFTSIAPGGYQFPYPITLYLTALPLSWAVTDHVLLLRLVAAGAEAVSCLFFYWMIVRGTGDRLTAAVATAILQLVPLEFGVLASANLTQVFGEAMAVIAMGLAVEVVIGGAGPAALAAAAAATLWAFLAHTSTFATLTGMLGMAGLLLLTAGAPADRRAALRLLAMLVIVELLAVALYYGHFMPTYRSEYARITGEMAGTVASPTSPRLYQPGSAALLGRLAAVAPLAASFYTWPFLVLAAAGLVLGPRRSWRDTFWLVIAGWLLACLAFLILGLLTPVDFRHYYAAIPAVAVLAGAAAVELWRRGGYWRWASALLTLTGTALGMHHWLLLLGAPLF
jgi:hypothetical protein